MMNKIPVIIDCDPGVDDSYAIALANSHPEFEIVALTAVEGNVPANKKVIIKEDSIAKKIDDFGKNNQKSKFLGLFFY